MKSTVLAAAILVSLAGSSSVLAEAPLVSVNPLSEAAVPSEDEATAQQTDTDIRSAGEAPVVELPEQQAVVDTLSEAAVTTAGSIEPPGVAEISAEAAAPAAEEVAEPAAPGTPAEEVAGGAMASGADMQRQPCPTEGMRKMGMGKGQHGKGPGGNKPGCDRGGKGQRKIMEQVVRRLDMIEARMAKMEAMLESLMQR